MKEFCFLITDKNHFVYYASANSSDIFDKNDLELTDTKWLDSITSPTPNFFSEVIRNEVEELGFFNGYISVSNNGKLWFCDYGKRYDTDGKHIGYDLVINKTADSATEYMKHFYANLEQKAKSRGESSAYELYKEEKSVIEQTVGTDFNEFITALQADYE